MVRSYWWERGKWWLLPLMLLLTFICLNVPTEVTPTVQAGAINLAPTPVVAKSELVGGMNAQRVLSMQVVLHLRNEAALERYVQLLSMPGSVLYHRYMLPAAFVALYAPTVQDVAKVTDYLQARGFRVTHVASGRQVIDFTGSVAQAEQAFGAQIRQYRAKSGRIFFANDAAPHVPLAIRPLIQSIGGLSDAVQRQTHVTRPLSLTHAAVTHVNCIAAGDSTNTQYYTPGQLASAYNFTALYNTGFHGEGQSVALFELDGSVANDIAAYRSCFDANSATRLITKLVDNGPGSLGAGALEVELDAEVLLGMLPHLANLVVYEAPNTDVGYNDEWAQIVSDAIPVVSTSWGACESNLTTADISAEQQFFLQAAAQGQTVLAASGDSGSYDCGDASLSVDDPASNPYVTGVGGTTLRMGTNATYSSESGWASSATVGSGGGVSRLWTMPAYQAGPGVVNGGSSGVPCQAASGGYCREVPDVALNADPNTGYIVYCTVLAASCDAAHPYVSVGGTSAAAPMWAAMTVLANQYAVAHGGTNLGFLNPTLYGFLQSANTYSFAFHDITTSSNLYYSAAANYDMVTGMGTFDAAKLVQTFVPGQTARTVPGNTNWYFAEGHLGNHFQEYVTLENPNVSGVAHVTIHYLLRGRGPMSQSLALNASTRTTVNVNTFMHVDRLAQVGQDVSLAITSDLPIMAERPMFFTFGGVTPGGSDIIGTTQPGLHFTFANGTTQAGYSTFLSILNPIGQPTAMVTATYYSGGVAIGQTTVNAVAGQRSTIAVNGVLAGGKQFFIQVDASQPVVVERPLYFHTTVAGVPGTVVGGSSVSGSTPAANWYFPAGDTGIQGGVARENILLANPDVTAANVSLFYALGNGTTKTVALVLPAKSQVIRSVNADVGNGALVAMKVTVTNNVGIVAERQQFFSNGSLVPSATGIEVLGVTAGNAGVSSVYSFAEGHLGSSFSEYTSLFNPNSSAVVASLTYFISNGSGPAIVQQQVKLPPQGVVRVSANAFLNVPSSATTASGVATDVSLVVQSLTTSGNSVLPLVAERSLYFNFVGTTPGATSVVGYSG